MYPATLWKDTLNRQGSSVENFVSYLGGLSVPFWAWQWDSSDPAAKSNSHSGHLTLPPMTLLKGWSHSCQPPCTRRLQVPANNVSGLAHHTNHFVYVGL